MGRGQGSCESPKIPRMEISGRQNPPNPIICCGPSGPEMVTARNPQPREDRIVVLDRVGIPKEILTDQGPPFVSKLVKDLRTLLHIQALRTSVCHPQTDGLIEWFNRTLKNMLQEVVNRDSKDWDTLLPFLRFAVREVPQASTGFFLVELLYGSNPQGILDLAEEVWEEQPNPRKSIIDHVLQRRDRTARVTPVVREHLEKAQEVQQAYYNCQATPRKFQVGDWVTVLVPTAESKRLARWQGPYEVIQAAGKVDDKVRQPDKRKPEQICHLNLLKPWQDREVQLVALGAPPQEENSQRQLGISPELTLDQRAEVTDMIERNHDVCSAEPGKTTETSSPIQE
nr:uncharacterized protein LOC112547827 [Pelodiscus sinensis]|eukprot:XP_025046797.1 uncharacterized protein LOC112547827 [Pelodiscus sinensis]